MVCTGPRSAVVGQISEQAYDSVGMFAAMRGRGVPNPSIRAHLRGDMGRMVGFVAPGTAGTELVQLHRVLSQGCPAIPMLFAVIIKIVLSCLDNWVDSCPSLMTSTCLIQVPAGSAT